MTRDDFIVRVIGQYITVRSIRGEETLVVQGTYVPPHAADVEPDVFLRFLMPFVGTRKTMLRVPAGTEFLAFLCGAVTLTADLHPGKPPATFQVERR